MKAKLTLLLVFFYHFSYSQISANKQTTLGNFIAAKEFSKEIALHSAKKFLVDEVIGASDDIIRFEIDALVAASSGELTSLVYKCDTKKKEGLILAFYNDYWNNSGIIYSGYGFKNLPKEKATELITKIQTTIKDNSSYLAEDSDNNNICFQYDDMLFIVYRTQSITKVRAFWNGFDSEWTESEINRTSKRLAKKLK